MMTVSGGGETTGTVTGTLLDAIRRGKVASDRLAGENAMLRAEVARLTSENAKLNARLSQRIGGRVL